MIPFDLPAWIVLPWLFLLGATLGSFLNVCIHRFPPQPTLRRQLRAIWWPPSHCPGCGQRILLRDNLPVVGWLMLRGKCRFCRRRIAFRYPLVEALNGLLFVAVYWVQVVAVAPYGPLPEGIAWNMPHLIDAAGWSHEAFLNWRYLYHMLLLEALVAATFIDLEHWIIPDGATLPAMAVGVLGGFLLGPVHLFPVWFQDPLLLAPFEAALPGVLGGLIGAARIPAWIIEHPHWHGLAASIAGIVVGGGMVWGVRIVGGWVLKKEAMGFGDVILLAMIGGFFGWQGAVIVFFVAPVAALAVVIASFAFRRAKELPYGPYLSLAAFAVVIAWPSFWRQTERIFSLGPLLPILGAFMLALLVASLLLIRGVKRLFGWTDDEWQPDWTSADQLSYQAGERADADQGRWREKNRWPGIDAAQGTSRWRRWRGR
ncbi:MAG: prepilin peptidase [Planctomycetaceae bacterium]